MNRRTWYGIVSAFGAAGALAASCSLGEGQTPDCDPSLKPGEAGACQDRSNCDNGFGIVDPTVAGCCQQAADREMRVCMENNTATVDVSRCMMTMDTCEQQACITHQVCLDGTLNGAGVGGAGGAGGGGGAGGAGGAGGMAGGAGTAGSAGAAGAGGN